MESHRNSSRTLIAAALLALLAAVPSFGGENRWSSNGPGGGIVRAIQFDPRDEGVMYAGIYGGGIFKSTNGGGEWREINEGIDNRFISTLAVSSSGTVFASAGGDLFRTNDAGEHWERLEVDFRGNSIRSIAFWDNAVLVATDGGMYRGSPERGAIQWESANAGLTGRSASFIFATDRGLLYAGTNDGLFVSSDGAANWSAVNDLRGSGYGAMAIDPRSGRLYVGGNVLYTSRDSRTWVPMPSLPAPFGSWWLEALLPDPVSAGGIYAATSVGLFYLREGDAKWSVVTKLLDGQSVSALLSNSAAPARLYAGANGGIYTSKADRDEWISSNDGLQAAYTTEVAVSPFDQSVIYAGTAAGIQKTSDGGDSWQVTSSVADWTNAVVIDPAAPSNVFGATRAGITKSSNAGEAWTIVKPSSWASALAVDGSSPATVYAALSEGMSKTTDGGKTWQWITQGLPYFYYGFYAESIVVDPVVSSIVYVGTYDGVFKTVDGGKTWAHSSPALNSGWDIRDLAIDRASTSILYAAVDSNQQGIFKTIDGGAHWTAVGLSGELVNTILLDPVDPATIYAGTETGVFRSTDGGVKWTPFNEGLFGPRVFELASDDSGKRLYAATAGGVFAYHIVAASAPEFPIDRLPNDPGRIPRLIDQLRIGPRKKSDARQNGSTNAFMIAAAGHKQGAGGTFFRSDVTLMNLRDVPQEVVVLWLVEGIDGSSSPSFHLTLPAQSKETAGKAITTPDFISRLGVSGIGSLVFIATDSAGNSDSQGSIDGFARTWTQQPSRSGTVSQSASAIGFQEMLGAKRAAALGLVHDASFRTNVGVINVDSQPHRFTVLARGERRTENFTVDVSPFSMIQLPLPAGDYGPLTITIGSDMQSTDFFWTFYATSVDNITGDSWMSAPRFQQ